EIREMVEAGQSEQQIKTFLTDRYGDFVLYRPRYTARNAVLWLSPVLLVVFGGLWWWRIIARRSALPIPDEDSDDDGTPGGGLTA
ncbi:MAG TPA: cytochrome c-type biogenesis protein CcmH, partial [Chromatiales bacterium]|nr:cytochrome c-type biogenesis protein CcmH [Chromatiales bacterium]